MLLYIFLFYELSNVLEKYIDKQKIYLIFLLNTTMIAFLLSWNISVANKNIQQYDRKVCFENNTDSLLRKHPEYIKVKQELEKKIDFNGNIFSFPADPIFYILFKQNVPYYQSIYEGSSIHGQNKSIEDIKNRRINYVIYNYKNYAVQDNVPNFIRAPLLHKYIINNFAIDAIDKNFIILDSKKDYDLFHDNKLAHLADFKQSLLEINLANIPLSEGYYKSKYLAFGNNQLLAKRNSIKELNTYLAANTVDSNNKFIVIKFKNLEKSKQTQFRLETKDSLWSVIYFNTCKPQNVCIINLSHTPIFYKNRIIKKIINNDTNIDNISVWKIVDDSKFW